MPRHHPIEQLATFAEMESDGATALQIADRLDISMRQVRRLRQQIAQRGVERIIAERESDSEETARAQQERFRWCDEAFQTAMRAAIAAGLERMPAGEAP